MTEGRKSIEEWKKHILRTVNQDRARVQILENLMENEVFIERDWAMKFLPMVYRESQSKWFAKRGINWHITVGSYKVDGSIVSHTLVHLFDQATQDASTSNAILFDALGRLHVLNLKLDRGYVRSDNAGCFHGYLSIFGVHDINKESPITISRMDFADPQGGKSICDRRAAHLKSAVRKYVNEGNDVRTASNFVQAIKCSNVANTSLIVCGPPSEIQELKILKNCPLKNITQFYNFLFKPDGLEIWKQFGIGKGQSIAFSSCFSNGNGIQRIRDIEDFTSESRPTSRIVTHAVPCENLTEPGCVRTDDEDEDACSNCNGLFSCPEINCKATFAYYGNLMHHLDVGNHISQRKSSCLSDRAKLSYSSKVDSKCIKQPQIMSVEETSDVPQLHKGWALKSKREVKRFSEGQKEFLKESSMLEKGVESSVIQRMLQGK